MSHLSRLSQSVDTQVVTLAKSSSPRGAVIDYSITHFCPLDRTQLSLSNSRKDGPKLDHSFLLDYMRHGSEDNR